MQNKIVFKGVIKMKWTAKTGMWVSVLIFVVLSATVFYISFIVKQNSLSVSLFGLFFVLFIGVLATILEYRMKTKNYSLLVQTVITLVLVNVLIFVILILVFSQNVFNYLIFTITYTLMYSLLTFIRYKLDSE